MPHPPIYIGTQDDDRTRSVDVVHIEPSIREGVHLVTSLYGREASFPLYHFSPTSSDNAWIRGVEVIPALLTAEEGTWFGSPTPKFAYQWMADGLDIPFATSKTWMSTPEYADATITVEIRGYNHVGEAYTISSSKVITLIEPIEVHEQELFLVSGLQRGTNAQITFDDRTMVATGLGTEDRMDVNRAVAYFLTGISADDRKDVNYMNIPVITGISQKDTLSVLERDLSIAIVNMEYADPLQTSIPALMNLKNPDAELGMLGWDIFGTVQYVSDDKNFGDYSWNGGDNVGPTGANTPFSYIWQDVPIEASWITDVDAGSTNLEMYWYQFSEEQQDMANVRVEYYNGGMGLIDEHVGPGLWASPNDTWFLRSFEDTIPATTRFIRVYLEFNLQSGVNNDAGIDDVSMFIRKGAKIVPRDFGPLFEQWRIRFTQANTWSGTGLSELEFKESLIDPNLATGGSPIFGSAGLGVANADFAFDGLRNTGYWAGELNAVANDRAWIGYDMGTPVRPEVIDITARIGGDSLQVGKEFYLEGSNDGLNWTKVQYMNQDRVGVFGDAERKQILAPRGAFDWYTTYLTGAGYTYTRDVFSVDDFAGKGCVWTAHTRMNLTDLRVLIDDNQASPFNFKLQLARVNFQKNGLFQPGMVTEVLEDFTLASAGVEAGLTWVSQVCSEAWEFEVGDSFLIRFYDLDAATNPVDPNEGRTQWISSYNDENTPYINREGVAERIATWEKGNSTIAIGDVNPTNTFTVDAGKYYALDFKGTIY